MGWVQMKNNNWRWEDKVSGEIAIETDILPKQFKRPVAASGYAIKDSGERATFGSGMVRDTSAGKVRYNRLLDGPMFDRWAEHLAKGAVKYPDVAPGVANWTLADSESELQRFKESAFSHFRQWLRGDTDEDHAAAVMFNINGAEYVKERLNGVTIAAR